MFDGSAWPGNDKQSAGEAGEAGSLDPSKAAASTPNEGQPSRFQNRDLKPALSPVAHFM
jgi:hypothetical protein